MTAATQSLAAIRYRSGEPVDRVLKETVDAVARLGFRVAGCLQGKAAEDAPRCADISLENIRDGRIYALSQPLGAGAAGCRLDPSTLAEASGDLLAALDAEVDLLVLNRFGRGEAEGHGFRRVIEKAHDRQVPVLTAVGEAWAGHWSAFGGGLAAELPAESGAVLEWCRAVLPAREG